MGVIGKLEKKISLEETEVHWEIPNFTSVTNDYHDSSDFEFLSLNWFLSIDAFHGDSEDDIALYLEVKKIELPCNIMCTFGIKKADGSLTGFKCFTHTFCSDDEILRADRFFTRSALQEKKSDLMPSNTLTIMCKLIHLSDKNGSLQFKDLDMLSENFKSLSKNKDSCDIILKVKEKEFRAHKVILMARSSVFAAMFEHDTAEKRTGIIDIPDCDPDSFHKFLDYLYCGKTENISFPSSLHLYKIADKYNVQELKYFCAEYMEQNLTEENICDAVILADLYDETKLMSEAQVFFNKNLSKIAVTIEWENFMKNNYRLANKLIIQLSKKIKNID